MIKVNLVGKAASVATVEVVIDRQSAVQEMESALERIGKRVRIPGFRQGKAPKAMVERFAGKPAVMQEAVEHIVNESYMRAVKENGLQPIADPDFEGLDELDLESEGESTFKMMLILDPEVRLADYKSFKMKKDIKAVTDEDVEQEVDRYAEQMAQYNPSDRQKVAQGDMVSVDFKGFINEGTPEQEAFEGGTAEGVDLLIGSGQFIPGFEEQLVGAGKGEEIDVRVAFPDDYHAKHLAGKPALFKCTIKEIKDKEVPLKDDELSKKMGFEKLDELRGAIKHSMEHSRYDSAVRALGVDALKRLTDGSEVEMPLAMVDSEAADMVNDLARRVKEQGMKWEDYLSSRSTTQDAVLEEMRPKAEAAVKQQQVVRALLRENDSRVTAAEIDRAIEMMAGRPGEVKASEVKRLKDNENVRVSVSRLVAQDKAIRLLSVICDEDPEEGKCKADHNHDHGHDHDHEHVHGGGDKEAPSEESEE